MQSLDVPKDQGSTVDSHLMIFYLWRQKLIVVQSQKWSRAIGLNVELRQFQRELLFGFMCLQSHSKKEENGGLVNFL